MWQVPVFHPTEEEFADFYAYVTSIESQVQPFGLCKIVPPASWQPRRAGYDDLSHVEIPSPIRQYVQGSQGVYQIINVMEKKMTFEDFKKEAQLQEERGMKAAKRRKKEDDKEEEFDEIEELERMYWKNLAFHAPLYGADMLGTLFDKPDGDQPRMSWDLNHLDSLLVRKLPHEIPGVTKPYLYFGMWKAMFGCHTEDMELFSINYLHFGKPKVWYCAPPSQKERFERLAQIHYPHHFKDCSQFLRHKSSLLSPSILRASSISLTRAVQREREFMITFPGAYHFGFNTGLNCAESVNFALESWVQRGAKAKSCQCVTDSVTIDMTWFDPTWKPEPTRASRKEAALVAAAAAATDGTTSSSPPQGGEEMVDVEPNKAPPKRRTSARKNAGKKNHDSNNNNKRQKNHNAGIPEDTDDGGSAPGAAARNKKRAARMPQKASPEKKRKIGTRITSAADSSPQQPRPLDPVQVPQLQKKTRVVTHTKAAAQQEARPAAVLVPRVRKALGSSLLATNRNGVPPMAMANDRQWRFSCMCGERVTSEDPVHQHPKGLAFECTQCQTWGHVNCYANFANKAVDELPSSMLCHICRARQHILLMKNGPSYCARLESNQTGRARLAVRFGPEIEFLFTSPVMPSSYPAQPSIRMNEPSSEIPGTASIVLPQPARSSGNEPILPRASTSYTFHQVHTKPRQTMPKSQEYQQHTALQHGSVCTQTPVQPGPNPTPVAASSSGAWMEIKPKAGIPRGKYNCGRCGQPKKGHSCAYGEGDPKPKKMQPKSAPATSIKHPPANSIWHPPATSIWHPPALPHEGVPSIQPVGATVIREQQSQLEGIKQRLQQLQQMQEQAKSQGVTDIAPAAVPNGYALQHFSLSAISTNSRPAPTESMVAPRSQPPCEPARPPHPTLLPPFGLEQVGSPFPAYNGASSFPNYG